MYDSVEEFCMTCMKAVVCYPKEESCPFCGHDIVGIDTAIDMSETLSIS
jgi:endogenous inhibitor of DNA gyrase (YacG/DUF329 family)